MVEVNIRERCGGGSECKRYICGGSEHWKECEYNTYQIHKHVHTMATCKFSYIILFSQLPIKRVCVHIHMYTCTCTHTSTRVSDEENKFCQGPNGKTTKHGAHNPTQPFATITLTKQQRSP